MLPVSLSISPELPVYFNRSLPATAHAHINPALNPGQPGGMKWHMKRAECSRGDDEGRTELAHVATQMLAIFEQEDGLNHKTFTDPAGKRIALAQDESSD